MAIAAAFAFSGVCSAQPPSFEPAALGAIAPARDAAFSKTEEAKAAAMIKDDDDGFAALSVPRSGSARGGGNASSRRADGSGLKAAVADSVFARDAVVKGRMVAGIKSPIDTPGRRNFNLSIDPGFSIANAVDQGSVINPERMPPVAAVAASAKDKKAAGAARKIEPVFALGDGPASVSGLPQAPSQEFDLTSYFFDGFDDRLNAALVDISDMIADPDDARPAAVASAPPADAEPDGAESPKLGAGRPSASDPRPAAKPDAAAVPAPGASPKTRPNPVPAPTPAPVQNPAPTPAPTPAPSPAAPRANL